MSDWYEFTAKEHQKDVLREAQRRRLIRELQDARREERSRLRDHSQKKTPGASELKSRSIQMDRAYRLYGRIATVVFGVNTVYPLATKLLQERLAEDWLHSVLHLCAALFGLYAGWYASNTAPAKVFTWGIGLLYLLLGLYGFFTSGLLLHTVLAIPLGVADSVFHLLLSVPALAIVVLAIRTSLKATSSSRRPYVHIPEVQTAKQEAGPRRYREEGVGPCRSLWVALRERSWWTGFPIRVDADRGNYRRERR